MNTVVKKNLFVSLLFLLIFSVSVASCGENLKSESQMENIIVEHLQVGDSKKDVESFLKLNEWSYAYDNDLRRFQARDLKEDELPDAVGRNLVYIYMDKDHRYVKSEVLRVYP